MSEEKEPKVWRIYVRLKAKFGRVEHDRDLAEYCQNKGQICIGWGGTDNVGEYLKFGKDEAISKIAEIMKAKYGEDVDEEWCASSAEKLYQFCAEIKKGDIVLMRGQVGSKEYNSAHIGEVVGDYDFREKVSEETHDYQHFFKVVWREFPIQRKDMGEELWKKIFFRDQPLRDLSYMEDKLKPFLEAE